MLLLGDAYWAALMGAELLFVGSKPPIAMLTSISTELGVVSSEELIKVGTLA